MESWGVLTAQSRRLRTWGKRLDGPRAPGGSSRPEPRPPLPTSRNPKLWATPPSGAFPRALTFRQQFWQEGVQSTALPALYGFS